jgi:hypothetical protein
MVAALFDNPALVYWQLCENGEQKKNKMIHQLVLPIDPLLGVAGVRYQFLGLKPQSNLILRCLRAVTSVDDVSDVQVMGCQYKAIVTSNK